MGKYNPAPGYPDDVWKRMDAKTRSKIRMSIYSNRPDVKERRCNYYKRPEVRLRMKEYNKRPDVRKKRIESAKRYNMKPNAGPNSSGPRFAGSKTHEQFCYTLLKGIRIHLKRLQKNENEYTIDLLIEMAKTYDKFIVDDTRFFPVRWTNGFYNSVSIQRWDNSVGYTLDNTTPIPLMLQSRNAFSLEQLQSIPAIIRTETPIHLIQSWEAHISSKCMGIFSVMASSIKKRKKGFGFSSNFEAAKFLRMKFIDQGGLCKFSGVPMILEEKGGAFMVSVERLNPIEGYNPNNIALICAALNAPVFGQHRWFRKNNNGSEAHIAAVKLASFNLDYWYQSMKYTNDDLKRIENIREYNRKQLIECFHKTHQ